MSKFYIELESVADVRITVLFFLFIRSKQISALSKLLSPSQQNSKDSFPIGIAIFIFDHK